MINDIQILGSRRLPDELLDIDALRAAISSSLTMECISLGTDPRSSVMQSVRRIIGESSVRAGNDDLLRYGFNSYTFNADAFIIVPQQFESNMLSQSNGGDRVADILQTLVFQASYFLSLQIDDPALFFESEGEFYQKPIIIYDKHKVMSDPQNPYSLFLKALKLMHEKGTINFPSSTFMPVVNNIDGVLDRIENFRVERGTNVIGYKDPDDLLSQAFSRKLLLDGGCFSDGFTKSDLVSYRRGGIRSKDGVVVFTSASPGTPEQQHSVQLLGQGLTEKRFAASSGAGATGLMKVLVDSMHEANGTSVGWITRAVLGIEYAARNAKYVGLCDNTNQRIYEILSHGRQIVAGAGSRGGVGTAHELLAYMLLLHHQNPAAIYIDSNGHNQPKPVYIDNAMGVLDPLVEIADTLGLNKREQILKLSGTPEILEQLTRFREANSRPFTSRFAGALR